MRINEKYFLAPAQRKGMKPILVLYEAPFRSNLPKKKKEKKTLDQ